MMSTVNSAPDWTSEGAFAIEYEGTVGVVGVGVAVGVAVGVELGVELGVAEGVAVGVAEGSAVGAALGPVVGVEDGQPAMADYTTPDGGVSYGYFPARACCSTKRDRSPFP